MLGELSETVFIRVAFVRAGFLSYTYFNKNFNHNISPQVIVSKTKEATTIILPKTLIKQLPKNPDLDTQPEVIEISTPEEVLAPGPLLAPTSSVNAPEGALTASGVIKDTNDVRMQNGGLVKLIENEKLDHDAQIKLSDMFAEQYFEHVSPAGVGPSDLAKRVGYDYILVGENLALGNFENDAKLMEAWMNSPGHRANILNSRYRDIGVAVGKGNYKGNVVWLAVQSFGLSLSVCPAIDEKLKKVIEDNNLQLANLRSELDAQKILVQSTSTNDPNYNIYAKEYNAMIKPYNELVGKNRILITNYNAEAHAFNDCAQMK